MKTPTHIFVMLTFIVGLLVNDGCCQFMINQESPMGVIGVSSGSPSSTITLYLSFNDLPTFTENSFIIKIFIGISLTDVIFLFGETSNDNICNGKDQILEIIGDIVEITSENNNFYAAVLFNYALKTNTIYNLILFNVNLSQVTYGYIGEVSLEFFSLKTYNTNGLAFRPWATNKYFESFYVDISPTKINLLDGIANEEEMHPMFVTNFELNFYLTNAEAKIIYLLIAGAHTFYDDYCVTETPNYLQISFCELSSQKVMKIMIDPDVDVQTQKLLNLQIKIQNPSYSVCSDLFFFTTKQFVFLPYEYNYISSYFCTNPYEINPPKIFQAPNFNPQLETYPKLGLFSLPYYGYKLKFNSLKLEFQLPQMDQNYFIYNSTIIIRIIPDQSIVPTYLIYHNLPLIDKDIQITVNNTHIILQKVGYLVPQSIYYIGFRLAIKDKVALDTTSQENGFLSFGIIDGLTHYDIVKKGIPLTEESFKVVHQINPDVLLSDPTNAFADGVDEFYYRMIFGLTAFSYGDKQSVGFCFNRVPGVTINELDFLDPSVLDTDLMFHEFILPKSIKYGDHENLKIHNISYDQLDYFWQSGTDTDEFLLEMLNDDVFNCFSEEDFNYGYPGFDYEGKYFEYLHGNTLGCYFTEKNYDENQYNVLRMENGQVTFENAEDDKYYKFPLSSTLFTYKSCALFDSIDIVQRSSYTTPHDDYEILDLYYAFYGEGISNIEDDFKNQASLLESFDNIITINGQSEDFFSIDIDPVFYQIPYNEYNELNKVYYMDSTMPPLLLSFDISLKIDKLQDYTHFIFFFNGLEPIYNDYDLMTIGCDNTLAYTECTYRSVENSVEIEKIKNNENDLSVNTIFLWNSFFGSSLLVDLENIKNLAEEIQLNENFIDFTLTVPFQQTYIPDTYYEDYFDFLYFSYDFKKSIQSVVCAPAIVDTFGNVDFAGPGAAKFLASRYESYTNLYKHYYDQISWHYKKNLSPLIINYNSAVVGQTAEVTQRIKLKCYSDKYFSDDFLQMHNKDSWIFPILRSKYWTVGLCADYDFLTDDFYLTYDKYDFIDPIHIKNLTFLNGTALTYCYFIRGRFYSDSSYFSQMAEYSDIYENNINYFNFKLPYHEGSFITKNTHTYLFDNAGHIFSTIINGGVVTDSYAFLTTECSIYQIEPSILYPEVPFTLSIMFQTKNPILYSEQNGRIFIINDDIAWNVLITENAYCVYNSYKDLEKTELLFTAPCTVQSSSSTHTVTISNKYGDIPYDTINNAGYYSTLTIDFLQIKKNYIFDTFKIQLELSYLGFAYEKSNSVFLPIHNGSGTQKLSLLILNTDVYENTYQDLIFKIEYSFEFELSDNWYFDITLLDNVAQSTLYCLITLDRLSFIDETCSYNSELSRIKMKFSKYIIQNANGVIYIYIPGFYMSNKYNKSLKFVLHFQLNLDNVYTNFFSTSAALEIMEPIYLSYISYTKIGETPFNIFTLGLEFSPIIPLKIGQSLYLTFPIEYRPTLVQKEIFCEEIYFDNPVECKIIENQRQIQLIILKEHLDSRFYLQINYLELPLIEDEAYISLTFSYNSVMYIGFTTENTNIQNSISLINVESIISNTVIIQELNEFIITFNFDASDDYFSEKIAEGLLLRITSFFSLSFYFSQSVSVKLTDLTTLNVLNIDFAQTSSFVDVTINDLIDITHEYQLIISQFNNPHYETCSKSPISLVLYDQNSEYVLAKSSHTVLDAPFIQYLSPQEIGFEIELYSDGQIHENSLEIFYIKPLNEYFSEKMLITGEASGYKINVMDTIIPIGVSMYPLILNNFEEKSSILPVYLQISITEYLKDSTEDNTYAKIPPIALTPSAVLLKIKFYSNSNDQKIVIYKHKSESLYFFFRLNFHFSSNLVVSYSVLDGSSELVAGISCEDETQIYNPLSNILSNKIKLNFEKIIFDTSISNSLKLLITISEIEKEIPIAFESGGFSYFIDISIFATSSSSITFEIKYDYPMSVFYICGNIEQQKNYTINEIRECLHTSSSYSAYLNQQNLRCNIWNYKEQEFIIDLNSVYKKLITVNDFPAEFDGFCQFTLITLENSNGKYSKQLNFKTPPTENPIDFKIELSFGSQISSQYFKLLLCKFTKLFVIPTNYLISEDGLVCIDEIENYGTNVTHFVFYVFHSLWPIENLLTAEKINVVLAQLPLPFDLNLFDKAIIPISNITVNVIEFFESSIITQPKVFASINNSFITGWALNDTGIIYVLIFEKNNITSVFDVSYDLISQEKGSVFEEFVLIRKNYKSERNAQVNDQFIFYPIDGYTYILACFSNNADPRQAKVISSKIVMTEFVGQSLTVEDIIIPEEEVGVIIYVYTLITLIFIGIFV